MFPKQEFFQWAKKEENLCKFPSLAGIVGDKCIPSGRLHSLDEVVYHIKTFHGYGPATLDQIRMIYREFLREKHNASKISNIRT